MFCRRSRNHSPLHHFDLRQFRQRPLLRCYFCYDVHSDFCAAELFGNCCYSSHFHCWNYYRDPVVVETMPIGILVVADTPWVMVELRHMLFDNRTAADNYRHSWRQRIDLVLVDWKAERLDKRNAYMEHSRDESLLSTYSLSMSESIQTNKRWNCSCEVPSLQLQMKNICCFFFFNFSTNEWHKPLRPLLSILPHLIWRSRILIFSN